MAYITQPWQQRVIEEKAELDEKIRKLDDFMKTLAFTFLEPVDRALLKGQRLAMGEYREFLADRISRFTKGQP